MVLAVIFTFVCAFVAGMVIAHYKLSPYQYFRHYFRFITVLPFKASYIETGPEINGFDPEKYLHLKSASDLIDVRRKLIEFIWSGAAFPLQRDYVGKTVPLSDSPFPITRASVVTRLDVDMAFGFNSIVFYFRPQKPVGKLVIFQQGHAAERAHDSRVINFFLDRGYDVAHIDMLLQNGNSRPIVETANFGKLAFRKHDQLRYLESKTFNPLKLFFEPVAATINYSNNTYHPSDISMIGLSGGGWITAVYSAIDSRITKSFPVAGTSPIYLRFAFPTTHWGDYEQTHPGLLSLASELDMYVMASTGNGRAQTQIFNLYDPCCYSGLSSLAYERQVQDAVRKIGLGRFNIWIDDSTMEHEISEHALHQILQSMTQ